MTQLEIPLNFCVLLMADFFFLLLDVCCFFGLSKFALTFFKYYYYYSSSFLHLLHTFIVVDLISVVVAVRVAEAVAGNVVLVT